jgi:hypothetical protein
MGLGIVCASLDPLQLHCHGQLIVSTVVRLCYCVGELDHVLRSHAAQQEKPALLTSLLQAERQPM